MNTLGSGPTRSRSLPKAYPSRNEQIGYHSQIPSKALDGTVYWPGLRMARDSKEMWIRLMTDAAGHIPEIGVIVDDEVERPAVQAPAPLTGENGVPMKMCMYDPSIGKWISGTPVSDTLPHPPPTYQVRLYILRFRKADDSKPLESSHNLGMSSVHRPENRTGVSFRVSTTERTFPERASPTQDL